MAFPFKKEWSEAEVGIQLREAFQDIVPLDFLIDFENFTLGAHQTTEAHFSSRAVFNWPDDSSNLKGKTSVLQKTLEIETLMPPDGSTKSATNFPKEGNKKFPDY